MNRLDRLFSTKIKDILNVYFTAGYPYLHDTETIILELEKAGVDLIELGMPYSDPMADGPTIQNSSTVALKNGMNVPLLFKQVEKVRKHSDIPLIVMGYFNQVMQYGEKAFFEKCAAVGIDGLILPDLPIYVFEENYRELCDKLNLRISFLISPQTSAERIRKIDELTKGFIYMVSSSSITGGNSGISDEQVSYFNRINQMRLTNPRLIGFGISNHETYATACSYSNGAIIGSAFIRALNQSDNLAATIAEFVKMIRTPEPVS